MKITINCNLDEMKEKFLEQIKQAVQGNPTLSGKKITTSNQDITLFAITNQEKNVYVPLKELMIEADIKWE